MDHDRVHLPPGAGEGVDLGGLGVQVKVRGEQTGGAFSVVEHPVSPGIVVEPHVHRHEDELTFVLEGTVWARVGDREVRAEAGSYIWKPRGVLHTFWNPGPGPARLLETISPAGLENFFESLATLLQGSPSEEDVYGLCDRYGLSFDRRWIPEIEARFGSMRMI